MLFGSDAEKIVSIEIESLVAMTHEEVMAKVVASFVEKRTLVSYFKLKVDKKEFQNYKSSRFLILAYAKEIDIIHPSSPPVSCVPMSSHSLRTIKTESPSSSHATLPEKRLHLIDDRSHPTSWYACQSNAKKTSICQKQRDIYAKRKIVA